MAPIGKFTKKFRLLQMYEENYETHPKILQTKVYHNAWVQSHNEK
jgi:hypothetical protein